MMQKSLFKLFFLFIILLTLLSSCSVQKRLYTKGFYTSKNQITKRLSKTDTTTSLSIISLPLIKEKKKNSILLTVNSKTQKTKSLNLAPKLIGGCDTIVLKSGAKILANISEINPTQIKFKNCGSVNEPEISINKDDITYVILSNGIREVFETKKQYIPPPPPPSFQPNNTVDQNYLPPQKPYYYETQDKYQKNISDKKTNPFAIAGFVFSLSTYPEALIFLFLFLLVEGLIHALGGSGSLGAGVALGSIIPIYWFVIPLIFSFIGLVCCVTAIYQISQNQENKKGLSTAIAGAVLSLLMMVLVLALFFIQF